MYPVGQDPQQLGGNAYPPPMSMPQPGMMPPQPGMMPPQPGMMPPQPGMMPMPQPGMMPPQPGMMPMPQPGMMAAQPEMTSAQPGMGLPPKGFVQPPPGGWPQPNTTCPPGLEYLMVLDHLFISQKVNLIEAVVGWEQQNKYVVQNARGETVYYIGEESGVCARLCLGSYRNCEFIVLDGVMREVLRMSRPLRCSSCFCFCCLQELHVYSSGVLLGSVVQNCSILRPSLSVRDASGETVLQIKGPILRRCVDVSYKVKSADGQHRVGMIGKKWSGFAHELFTDADNYGISFPMDLDVKIKAVLLGACLLIDFMYFETSGKDNL